MILFTFSYFFIYTSTFKKDLKRAKKRGLNLQELDKIISKLQCGESLEPKHKDHPLKNNWAGYRECHINADWLLIYEIYESTLVLSLARTCTHSDVSD